MRLLFPASLDLQQLRFFVCVHQDGLRKDPERGRLLCPLLSGKEGGHGGKPRFRTGQDRNRGNVVALSAFDHKICQGGQPSCQFFT